MSATDDPKENVGAKVSINGNIDYDVRNRYHTLSGDTYHLSAIALQAYFNTTDIASLLYEKDINGRVATPYSKAQQDAKEAITSYGNVEGKLTKTPVLSAYANPFSSYKVITSIKKLKDLETHRMGR